MLNLILSESSLPVTHLSDHTHTHTCNHMQQMYTNADANEHMCIPTFSRENDLMWPNVTPTTAAAAAARCIPGCIPDFPTDIPAQCGGNLPRVGFTGTEAV